VPISPRKVRFYITYIFCAALRLIEQPLQAIDKISGFRAGGLPGVFRAERQWDLVNQALNAVDPLEDLPEGHGQGFCSDRSLAGVYVNSGAQEIACRATVIQARLGFPAGKTISFRASIDNTSSGRLWGRISFFFWKKLCGFSCGVEGGRDEGMR